MSFFDRPDDRPRGSRFDHLFLEGLTEKEWQTILKFGESRTFSAGDVLVSEGEQDDSFYILMAGTIDVQLPGGKKVATIPEGSVFGEIAFFDGQPRSATNTALTDGSAIRLTRRGFDTLAAWEPVLARRILLELGKALALRLRYAQRRTDD
jgi:CRP-like cAMP-binding protein